LISQALTLAASVIAARLLGKVQFGELGMIYSTLGMFGVLAGFGLGLTATKHIAEFRSSDPERAGRILGLSSVVAWVSSLSTALLIVSLAPWLSRTALSAPHLARTLRIGAILLLFNAVNGAQTGALSGFEAFREIAGLNLVRGAITFPLVVGGVMLANLNGAVAGFSIAAAAGCAVTAVAIRRKAAANSIRITYRRLRSELPVLWRFAIPAAFASSLVGPVMWCSSTFLIASRNGYAEMGVFSAANQWRNAVLFLPGLIGQVMLPVLSDLWGQSRYRDARKLLFSAIPLCLLAAGPILLPMFLLHRQIMSMYGSSFASRGAVLLMTGSAAALIAVQSPVATLVAAASRMWVGAAMNAAWALVLLGSSWSFLRANWGADGLAAAYLVAYAAHSIWTFGFAAVILNEQRLARQGASPIQCSALL
jgi:O-antigen/teichoic acid export membrane protein